MPKVVYIRGAGTYNAFMQYFYLNISQTASEVSAQVSGMYRDNILGSLSGRDDVSLVLVNCSELTVKAITGKMLGREIGEGSYIVTGREKAGQLIQLYGPSRLLSHENASIFIYSGELPRELEPADLKKAHAAISFKNQASVVEVSRVEMLELLVRRALVKLIIAHIKKSDRAWLPANSGEVFKQVIREVIATAARTGITINNFPGPKPGLCTLWFTTGDPLTLRQRTALAQNPPDMLDIGEITIEENWSARFIRKSAASPELFAAYLRIGVESAKATCGCLGFLACALLGLIPAFALGGSYRFLPGACLAGAVAFGLASRLLLRLKRKALNRIRLKMTGRGA